MATKQRHNVELGLYIGANLLVDAIQAALDLVAIGAVINRFIDIFWGLCDAFYVQMRLGSIGNAKRFWGFVGTFIIEEIPGVDLIPAWTLDAIYNVWLHKTEVQLEKSKLAQMAVSKIPQTPGKK
jgi:hypothetical protein